VGIVTDPFVRHHDADVRDLIAEFPLAWVSAADGRADQTALLPLLGDYDGDGKLISLLGHIPRRHPLVSALEADARTMILFQGPQAYISPEQAGIEDWAPTWNFACLSIEAETRFIPEETDAALARLVDVMEQGRTAPWSSAALGDRYPSLADRVIAFRAQVRRVIPRFKLGQDERPAVREAIIGSLGDTALAHWMRRFDRDAAREG
jgi:transcriptional regulator